METKNEEYLDSETQDNDGDDVATEEVEDTSSETSDEDEQTEHELEKARQIAEDQKRRAEKAEQKLKELKAKSEPKSEGQEDKPKKESSDSLTKEEAILYAKGLSEEEVEKVKSIAKIEGESPLVSAESDYFKLWKEKEEKKREEQETQLDTSRGSAKVKPKKDFGSPQLSADEHKALWKKKMGL